jgi:hypothetical protein
MAKNENLALYDIVRAVPKEAQKKITGGRINGMTDINPMWRLKSLTEQFGMCGTGWKYVIKEKRLEKGGKDEIAAFVDIDLFLKVNGEWSDAIPGTGGSMFVTSESKGLYTSDECFKMALTDAISVACKALGFGADIYFEKDRSKYDSEPAQPGERVEPAHQEGALSEKQIKRLFAIASSHGWTMEAVKKAVMKSYGKTSFESLSKAEYEEICEKLQTPKQSSTN